MWKVLKLKRYFRVVIDANLFYAPKKFFTDFSLVFLNKIIH